MHMNSVMHRMNCTLFSHGESKIVELKYISYQSSAIVDARKHIIMFGIESRSSTVDLSRSPIV